MGKWEAYDGNLMEDGYLEDYWGVSIGATLVGRRCSERSMQPGERGRRQVALRACAWTMNKRMEKEE